MDPDGGPAPHREPTRAPALVRLAGSGDGTAPPVTGAAPGTAPCRPRLRPGLPRAWRDLTTLQIGTSGGRGAILTGVRDGDEAVLACLDGFHDLTQVEQAARRAGVAPWRVAEILDVLGDAGLLVTSSPADRGAGARRAGCAGRNGAVGGDRDGTVGRDRTVGRDSPERYSTGRDSDLVDRADLALTDGQQLQRLTPDAEAWASTYEGAGDGVRLLLRRGGRHVRVEGAGRVGSALAATLTAAGVGTVSIRAHGTVSATDVLPAGAQAGDVGASPAVAAARVRDRLGRPHEDDLHAGPVPGPSGAPPAPARPDLVVLIASRVVDPRRGDRLMRADVPHLAVVTMIDRVVVGPLVLPGQGPCLRCLDLHRRDRDPAWPVVLAQLVAASDQDAPRCETALATAAAGLAALQVLTLLDGHGEPASHAHALEVRLPDGLVRSRAWGVHPSCGCTPPPWDQHPRDGDDAA